MISNSSKYLINILNNNKVCVFCGAGISMWSPTNGLSGAEIKKYYIKSIINDRNIQNVLNNLTEDNHLRPERVLSIFYEYCGIDSIKPLKLLNNTEPNALHYAIAKLFKRGFISSILTTNFDQYLENIIDDVTIFSRKRDFLYSQPNSKKSIVKIHGSIENILTMRTRIEQVLSPLSKPMRSLLRQLTKNMTLLQ